MTYSNTKHSVSFLLLVSLLAATLFIATPADARERDVDDVRDEVRDDSRQDRDERDTGRDGDDDNDGNNGGSGSNGSGGSSTTNQNGNTSSTQVNANASGGESVFEIVENTEVTVNDNGEVTTVRNSNTVTSEDDDFEPTDTDSRHSGGIVRVTESTIERHGR